MTYTRMHWGAIECNRIYHIYCYELKYDGMQVHHWKTLEHDEVHWNTLEKSDIMGLQGIQYVYAHIHM